MLFFFFFFGIEFPDWFFFSPCSSLIWQTRSPYRDLFSLLLIIDYSTSPFSLLFSSFDSFSSQPAHLF